MLLVYIYCHSLGNWIGLSAPGLQFIQASYTADTWSGRAARALTISDHVTYNFRTSTWPWVNLVTPKLQYASYVPLARAPGSGRLGLNIGFEPSFGGKSRWRVRLHRVEVWAAPYTYRFSTTPPTVTHTHTCRIHSHTLIRIHTLSRIRIHKQFAYTQHTHSHTCTHSHKHTYPNTLCIHTHTRTHLHTHIHIHTHRHTHTHSCARTHTHTHTVFNNGFIS